MFHFDPTTVERIRTTLVSPEAGWHPLATACLLTHLESYQMMLLTCDLQVAQEYEELVRLAIGSLDEHPDLELATELYDRVQDNNTVILSATYYAIMAQYDRRDMEDIVSRLNQLMESFASASIA